MQQLQLWPRMRLWELRELCEDKGMDYPEGATRAELMDLLSRASLGKVRGIEEVIRWGPGEKRALAAARLAAKKGAQARDARTRALAKGMGLRVDRASPEQLRAQMSFLGGRRWGHP